MGLMLHRGAQEIEFDRLRALQTPVATSSHVPLPHFELVNMVKYALGYYGHEITDEHYGITEDGNRFFGALSLRSEGGLYTDLLGLRNSHDKTMPIGIAFGSRVFVCDNMAFIGDTVVKRKHTAKSKHDLPALIAEIVEPLRAQREAQHVCFERYRTTALDDLLADHAIMNMYRRGVIGIQKVDAVLGQWENPAHDWGPKSAWRLFNGVTHVLEGRVAETPALTKTLHQIVDATCEMVH